MANPSRKMATMRKVDAITPIEGADRIECAHIGGWTCVVGKGDFEPGDLCVYYEVDSFLPTGDPRYAQFAERGEKVMTIKDNQTRGHVLRTIKLGGQISQGLLMRPQDVLPESVPEHAFQLMYERRARLDGICGVCEYHPDQSSLAAGFIGEYDPFVAPRTGCEHIQNVDQETFDLIKRCGYFTSVKVDGTSITLVNDSRHGRIRAFSHNNEFSLDEGQGKLVMETAKRQGLLKFLESWPDMTIQAELCGPKIGGNALRLKDYRLFVFSVYDVAEREYLAPYDFTANPIAVSIYLSGTPCVEDDVDVHGRHFLDQFDTPQDLIEWTNTLRGSVTKDVLDEGIVVHVMDTGDLSKDEQMTLRNALGEQMQMKSVSAAFLLKKKG